MSFRYELVMGMRMLARLPSYLRNPLTIPEARAILRQRLNRREQDFLDLIKPAIFGNPLSPYRALLQEAGCEYGDIEHLVKQEGLEESLLKLFHAGIYLTVDEYKGRRSVVRGKTVLSVTPQLLHNPLVVPQFCATTSGSRGAAVPIPVGLDCIRDRAVNMLLSLDARGGSGWKNAVWGMPGIGPLLWYSICGGPAAGWFLLFNPKASNIPRKYRGKFFTITWAGRIAGVPMPSAEYVSIDEPLPIARWMNNTLEAGNTPHLWSSPSAAVRLCRAAEKAGISLAGAKFTVTGEPVTEAGLAVIRNLKGDAAPDYGSADSGGSAGYGCLSPEASDDIHVFNDLHALIQADAPPFPPKALLLTSIRPTVPFIFLNMSMGDCATLTSRECGCPMEKLGWRTHLHTIRSYEKMTAGGITFLGTDIIRILEVEMPRRFGGGPSDYQLVEETTEDGHSRLRLLVHPCVGPADCKMLSAAFLDALGSGSHSEQIMAHSLQEGGLLEVERKAPHVTTSGKILHLWSRSAVRPEG